jgi:hypothetical protein
MGQNTGTQGMDTGRRQTTRGISETTTNGSAVFVGRASFRMTPPARASLDAPTKTVDGIDSGNVGIVAPPASGSETGVEWFVAAEERVVLSPPAGVQAAGANVTETAGVATQLADVADVADMTGGGFVVTGDVVTTPIGPGRRPDGHARPIWLIAAAMVVGATVALSTRAVFHEPSRATPETKPAETKFDNSDKLGKSDELGKSGKSGLVATSQPTVSHGSAGEAPVVEPIGAAPPVAAAPGETQAVLEPSELPSELPAQLPTSPTSTAPALPVVAAVVALLADPQVAPEAAPDAAPDRARRSDSSGDKVHRAHAGHSSARSNARLTPVHRANKRAATTATTWVDPFVSKDGPGTSAPATATPDPPKSPAATRVTAANPTKISRQRIATKTTWVDPFAN